MPGRILLIIIGAPGDRVRFNHALRGSSHRLIFAADGVDGLDRLAEVKPDLVVAHVKAPRLDGVALGPLIRDEEDGDAVPILLYGEALEGEAQTDCVARGKANGYLAAPFDTDALLAAIAQFDVPDEAPAESQAPGRRPSVLTEPRLEGLPEEVRSTRSEDGQITLDSADEDELVIDPRLAAMALAADAEDEIERPLHPAEISTSNPALDVLAEPEAPNPREISAQGDEVMPVFIAPAGLQNTPTGVKASDIGIEQALAQPEPVRSEAPLPDALVSVSPIAVAPRDMIEEPELPTGARERADIGLGTAVAHGTDTGRRLIEEMPLNAPSAAPVSAPGFTSDPPSRGLEESQLGPRLVQRAHETFALLTGLDHYQLLNIEPTSTDAQIRDAYFRLALEFHPDRFFLLRSGGLKEKIYAIFRRISVAFDVLGDARRRAQYDGSLGPQSASAIPDAVSPTLPAGLEIPTQTQEGRRYVQLAAGAHADGDLDGARMFLTFARVHEPENDGLRAACRAILQQSQTT